jgi:hypothetical protein
VASTLTANALTARTYQAVDWLVDRDGDQSGFSDSEAKDDTVTPYAPSAAVVVTTVTPEANRPAACRKV